jgi:hypothetical protein
VLGLRITGGIGDGLIRVKIGVIRRSDCRVERDACRRVCRLRWTDGTSSGFRVASATEERARKATRGGKGNAVSASAVHGLVLS